MNHVFFKLEIKRWKDADVEDYSHVPCAAPSGGDWSNIPVSSGVVSNNASPPATAAVWGDPQPAPGHPLNDGTERWGAPPQTSAWGEPTKVVSIYKFSLLPAKVSDNIVSVGCRLHFASVFLFFHFHLVFPNFSASLRKMLFSYTIIWMRRRNARVWCDLLVSLLSPA